MNSQRNNEKGQWRKAGGTVLDSYFIKLPIIDLFGESLTDFNLHASNLKLMSSVNF